MSPTETVQSFLKAWEPANGWKTAIRDYFTADCVYENVGLTNTTGPAASIAVLEAMAKQLPFVSLKVDMLGIAAQGNTVMTERVDHLLGADGKALVSIRLMGVFEVQGGKIKAWRDYFDSRAVGG
ncbi:MAG: nuclear transport factor 2 family protein [Nevskia sp.]|nr:nuclear transport factor 2 family protein [Nevskia sp.]